MKTRDYLLTGYLALCAIALVWPAYPLLANRLTPQILGLPFSFAWNIGWVVSTFCVLAAYHFTGDGEETDE